MVLPKLGWLTLSALLIVLPGTLDSAESKTSKKKSEPLVIKRDANIKGFRSAKFGMNEKDVLKAIAKDFKVSKNKILKKINPVEKTKRLEINVPKIMDLGGKTRIAYIFGFKSRKLIQINIIWGNEANKPGEKFDADSVIDAANFLRNHFMKKKYQKDRLAINSPVNDETMIVFRGKDKKGRMALLVLTTPKKQKDEDIKTARLKIMLKLSYMYDPENPDILSIRDDDF
tara:strand:- start:15 stop:701 length:687 start_codon:yes stop_codon:yes gene_type:complete